jgi:pSer/pThr/pTyr-binding forkhead associated (FHA) protein
MENASTELMPVPVAVEPTEPDHEARPEDAAPAALAVLALSDGQRVDLLGTVRIGRAPSPEPGGDPGTQLVTVPSPQQDISRTHLQIHPQAGQIVVTDLHSTNGTMLVLPGTELYAQRLPSGEAVAVPLGSVLDLGDGLSVSIERPH